MSTDSFTLRRLTARGPNPSGRRGTVGPGGVEPPPPVPKTGVLPLDDGPVCAVRCAEGSRGNGSGEGWWGSRRRWTRSTPPSGVIRPGSLSLACVGAPPVRHQPSAPNIPGPQFVLADTPNVRIRRIGDPEDGWQEDTANPGTLSAPGHRIPTLKLSCISNPRWNSLKEERFITEEVPTAVRQHAAAVTAPPKSPRHAR